ncbi:UNVERIFIED_CONTAM: hypothetical protein PYX00_007260 [Menopon gallinae]|uniref:Protein regulator of cytokinesis 1 n=1 Tax=Menopon gallinae TaxID=328185 RepID=A0AAW2HIC3_9NEOP
MYGEEMECTDRGKELHDKLIESVLKNNKRLIATCRELASTWSELWDENERNKRENILCAKFEEEIYEFLEEVANKEKLTKDDYIERIESLLNEIHDLKNNLEISIPYEDVENLPLHNMAFHLNRKAEKYRIIKNEYIKKKDELVRREAELCERLDTMPVNMKFSPIPKETELKQFEKHIAVMEQEVANRKLTLTETSQKIQRIFKELDIKPSLNFERDVISDETHENFVLSNENMKQLEDLLARLEQQVEELKERAEELCAKLNVIWDYLDEPEEHRKQFLETHTGYSMPVINALREELDRCEEIKKKNISKIVVKMRQVLTEEWDKCLISKDEREKFRPFYSDCYTQDLLDLHECEIERLRNYYRENEEIFTLIPKHEKLFKKLIDLENTSKNANRYYNRGGQLLQEERERKQITKELPVVEEELRAALRKYEEEKGTPFTSYGVPMLFILDDQWTAHFDQKTIEKLARRMGSDKKRKTPLGKRTLATPASLPANKMSRMNAEKVVSSTTKCLKTPGSARLNARKPAVRKCFPDQQPDQPDTTYAVDSTYDEFQNNLQAKVETAKKGTKLNLRSTSVREAVTTPVRPVLREQNTPILLRSATCMVKTTPSKFTFTPMYSPSTRKTPKTLPRPSRRQSQAARLTPAVNRLPLII